MEHFSAVKFIMGYEKNSRLASFNTLYCFHEIVCLLINIVLLEKGFSPFHSYFCVGEWRTALQVLSHSVS